MEKIAGRLSVRYSPDVTALKRYGNNGLVECFATIELNKATGEALFVHFRNHKNFIFMLAMCSVLL